MNLFRVASEQFQEDIPNQSALDTISIVLGLLLFLLPCVSALLVSYSNLLTIPIGPWLVILSYVIVSCFLFSIFRNRVALFFASIFIGTILLCCSVWLSSTFHVANFSDDGGYHYPATYEIAHNKWNPVWDYQGEDAGFLTPKYMEYSRLEMVGITAKAQWFAAAAMASLVGKTISGNYTHLIFILAGFFLIYTLCKRSYGQPSWVACLISLAFACNPIATSEMFCGFIDGVAASTATIFFIFFATFFYKKTYWHLLVAGFALAFCIGTRTTFIFFATICLIAIPFVSYFFSRYKIVPLLQLALVIAIIWLPVIANPYLYSFIKYGDPIYPQIANRLWLKDAQVCQTPPFNRPASSDFDKQRKKLGIDGMGSVREFLSTQVVNYGQDRTSLISPKSPHRFDYSFSHYHPSNGGFGPLYGVAFLLAIPLLLLLILKRNWFSLATVAIFSITVFFFPLPYYTRYFGYAWMLPAIVSLFALVPPKYEKPPFGLAILILSVMLINSIMLTHAVFTRCVVDHDKWLELDRFVRLHNKLGVVKYSATSSIPKYIDGIRVAITEAVGEPIEITMRSPQEVDTTQALKIWIHTLYPQPHSLYKDSDIQAVLLGIPVEIQNARLITKNLSITAPPSWVAAFVSPYLDLNGKPEIPALMLSNLKLDKDIARICVRIVVDSSYSNKKLNEILYADLSDGYGENGRFSDVHKYLSNGVNLLIADIPKSCGAVKIRLVAKELSNPVRIISISYVFLNDASETTEGK